MKDWVGRTLTLHIYITSVNTVHAVTITFHIITKYHKYHHYKYLRELKA